MGLLIKNGTLVTEGGILNSDLRIKEGEIQALGVNLPTQPGDQVLEAAGCYVMPGTVDCHLHFALRAGQYVTADDFAAGTRSAACGGVTAVIDFVSQFPGDSLLKALDDRLVEMEGKLHIDASLHVIVTDLSRGQEAELPQLVERGVTSLKIYTTYRQNGFYCDDYTWSRVLTLANELGMVVMVHAENDAIVEETKAALAAQGKTALRYHPISRPGLAEIEAVNRGLFLAQQVGGAPIYFVHLSMGQSPALIAEARARGELAFAETCLHYLLLSETVYEDEPARFLMTPPLRPKAEQEQLWAHIEGGAVDTVASDHCGYTLDQRTTDDFREPSPGIPGVETSLMLLYTAGVATGRISMHRLVQLLSTNPARVFGLYPRKGSLTPGADADVVIYDPREAWTLTDDDLHSNAGFTPYTGTTIQGRVRTTISRGRIVWHEGEFRGNPGHGRFLKRDQFDPSIVRHL